MMSKPGMGSGSRQGVHVRQAICSTVTHHYASQLHSETLGFSKGARALVIACHRESCLPGMHRAPKDRCKRRRQGHRREGRQRRGISDPPHTSLQECKERANLRPRATAAVDYRLLSLGVLELALQLPNLFPSVAQKCSRKSNLRGWHCSEHAPRPLSQFIQA